MAATLKAELGIDALLVEGNAGEFSVWVGDNKVVEKGWLLLPSARKVIDAVGVKRTA